MPGSTTTSSTEQPKAKVTESSATNGIFVRPVAVAGIFRPSEETANKPPALPEKRRFSALAGDLTPCSSSTVGNLNDDFTRRRQSWDTKTKEVPFGQSLLRKTPRNSNASLSLPVKQELSTNGSSHEDASRSDKIPDTKSTETLNSTPDISIKNPVSIQSVSVKDKPINDISNKVAVRNDVQNAKELKPVKQIDSKIQNHYSNETTLNVSAKKLNDVNVNSTSKIIAVSENKTQISDSVVNLSANTTDNTKKPKKVYGLIKRDSKIDTNNNNETTSIRPEPKSRKEPPAVESFLLKKEESAEISSKIEISSEKSSVNSSGSKIKTKVYGISKKTIVKDNKDKDTDVNKQPAANLASIPIDANVVNKPPEINLYDKKLETINKSSDNANKIGVSVAVNKASENTSFASKSIDTKIVEAAKITDNAGEFQKARSPPKDFRTVRRTSDVIAARIQNIFSNISTPEKAPPPVSKKTKIVSKENINSNISTNKTEDKNAVVVKADITSDTKDNYKNQVVNFSKIESKSGFENTSSKIEIKNSPKIPLDVEPKLNTNDKRSDRDATKEEGKYKQPTQTLADRPGLKKEKIVSGSRDVLQSCKSGEVVTTYGVTEPPLKKADSKTEHSIAAVPSKAPDKKTLNIGGKMPIKQDENSSGSTPSLRAANQVDRKSTDLSGPPRTVKDSATKGLISKTETTIIPAGSGENVSKNVSTSSFTSNTTVVLKNNYNVSKKVESNFSLKESGSSLPSLVPQTHVKTSTVEQVSTVTSSCSNGILQSQINKVEKTVKNGNVECSQVSKIEVAHITPSTVPGIVPTINVLFRTKSPISSATKEENRKKVVVETYSSTSPVPSTVINASKVPENLSVQPSSKASESFKEALKTVENVQKTLNSPKLPIKHSIVNLKKEELVSVTLAPSDSESAEITMPPNSSKIEDKCSSSVGNKVEVSQLSVKPKMHDSGNTENMKRTSCDLEPARNIISPIPTTPDINNISSVRSKISDESHGTDFSMRNSIKMDRSSLLETKTNVVDLGDWNKKFQRIEPEPPRAPLRRRAARESMPPSMPIRSRFGSLKRIDDSPRYVPRSPSQSSLPQRYSYTEMLSKVCSMGVLPYVEPSLSKSCSSSSSQVSELWSELSEEQSTGTHTSEMLEAETTERMRLEKEVQELQNRCSQVQIRSDKMEMEMMEARVYRTPELNGDLSEDEDVEANSSLYKQKYDRAVRDMEIMKRRIQQQHEEEMEQKAMLKKASDKRLAEALEDVEEERQVANQWKRKAQKLGSELQDLRLMLEEQMARNGELEKKQRRFDAELSVAQEEIKKERLLREKFAREKEQALHEKYSLEQDLQSTKLDSDTLHEKITQLNRELDELTLSSKGEEEVTQLKRAKQELERKNRDQEEELEELAAQVGMLEQAKLRLEMSLEKVRQEHRREASVREEEIEEIRASFSKKIKNLEAQLEAEQDERHQLVKQKHELERRLYEIADQPPPQDPEIERRLRRDLKRTKALLRDAQSMLEHTREGQSGKTLIRQLKNQLEDSEFAKAAAVKARQAVEAELQECQAQLEEATRAKNEAETRCLQLSREKSAIQTQLEEAEEEMAEVMKKYKAVVAQMSIDQKALSEQNQQIADLETEKQMLRDQLSEVSHKFEHLAGQSEDTHKVHRLDGKVRDLESKLELEQTTRSRLEHQIARLKEQNDRAREECDTLRNKELQAQEGVRRLQRQVRELREDYSALQQKEAEAYRKQHELEMALENNETDLQVTKNDLRLACQRIQDLQNALEDDLDSGTDVPDDSGSDSDESFELAMMRNHSVTPTQRCDSVTSNYSYASEGIRSPSSFTHELSAFSRMMLRRTSMDFLG